jgi:hypothetical protein
MLGAYNGVLARGVCDLRESVDVRRPSSTLYVWWAGVQCIREGVPSPAPPPCKRPEGEVRSAILHVSRPGLSVEHTPPLPQAKSRPTGPWHRRTYPWSFSPSPWQRMSPSSLGHASPNAPGAVLSSGRQIPTSLALVGGSGASITVATGSVVGPASSTCVAEPSDLNWLKCAESLPKQYFLVNALKTD